MTIIPREEGGIQDRRDRVEGDQYEAGILRRLVMTNTAFILAWGGCATIGAALLFLVFPEIDLIVASFFFTGREGQQFLFQHDQYVGWIRDGLEKGFIILCLAIALSLIVHIFWRRRLFGLDWRRASFLILSFALGPGLLVNSILKNHWGRARPAQITAFGGEQEFTPALIIADQCERNCSFVSGEAAVGFSLLAVALLVSSGRRHFYIWAVVGFGCFIGFLRIGAGGHFLSDVVFAGLFVSFLTVALHHVMIDEKTDKKIEKKT